MRLIRAVPVVLLAAGVALVADAVLRGGATLALVVVFPVVSGGTAEFLLGAVLLFVGFATLPLALFPGSPDEDDAPAGPPLRSVAPPAEGSAGGGLILVGPIPIFFGGWKNVSRRTRWWVAAAGGLLLVVLVAIAFLGVP